MLAAGKPLLYGCGRSGKGWSTKKECDLPRLHSGFSLCALAVAGLLSACSASGGGLEQIAPTSLAELDDPVLPDEVAVQPSPSGVTAEPGRETTASIHPAANAMPIVAAAYAGPRPDTPAAAAITPGRIAARSPELDALIARYADRHQIPEELLRRVVHRESTFNPAARNGPYWGLMQILPQTARTMGYSGAPEGLLDAETNLMYAGKYLRGAYLVADGDHDLAVRYYSRGYYYDAKRRGMLEATGLGKDRRRMR